MIMLMMWKIYYFEFEKSQVVEISKEIYITSVMYE